MSDEQDRILKMVEEGTLSAAEANDMLEALETDEAPAEQEPSVPDTLQRPWQVPVAGGLLLLAAGGWGLARLTRREPSGPLGPLARMGAGGAFLLGLLLTAVGLWSRNAVWLHVRVEEKDGATVNVRLPLPLGLTQSVMAFARDRVDDEAAGRLDAAAAFLGSIGHGEKHKPFTVEASQGEDTRVFVYLG